MYRPSISPMVDERVDMYMVGRSGNKKDVYERAVKAIIDSGGNERLLGELVVDSDGHDEEWLIRLNQYCDKHNADRVEVMNQIFSTVIDEDGDANIQFKKRLDL